MTKPTPVLVLSTCPDQPSARRIADHLVEQRLAACVNLLPGMESIYSWQGRIERAPEVLLLIKTRSDKYPALEAAIRQHHPYELPEVVQVSIEGGLPGYLQWINHSLDQL